MAASSGSFSVLRVVSEFRGLKYFIYRPRREKMCNLTIRRLKCLVTCYLTLIGTLVMMASGIESLKMIKDEPIMRWKGNFTLQ